MRYVYFTKTLQKLDVPALVAFCKDAGLDGVDFTVRKDYPVNPDNVKTELPRAARAFQAEKLTIGLVTVAVDLNDAESATIEAVFETCGQAGLPAIKIGYFPYKDKVESALTEARTRLAAFARLAEKTGVKACYHTHSGNYLGNNSACLRLLLQDLDPHHIGAIVDTGHTAVNGGPIRLELDLVRPWLSLLAIKDMAWEKKDKQWSHHVVPAGEGIVQWDEVAKAVKECRFNGTITLHGEYETHDLDERKKLAKQEVEFLRQKLG